MTRAMRVNATMDEEIVRRVDAFAAIAAAMAR